MATQDTGSTAPRPSYPKNYVVLIRLRLDSAAPYKPKEHWVLDFAFQCHDLLRTMEEGLLWTTSNVVPGRGWINRWQPSTTYSQTHTCHRVWELSECPGRPEIECRWVAIATLNAHSEQVLGDFRLRTLSRRNVDSVCAAFRDQPARTVFRYGGPSYNGPGMEGSLNYNCFEDRLQPSHGSWWFWPMEELPDYDADEARSRAGATASSHTDQEKPPAYSAQSSET